MYKYFRNNPTYEIVFRLTPKTNLLAMDTSIISKITNHQFTEVITQASKEREKEFFLDGNFDYYSKSKSKKYRASKYRLSEQ